MVLFKTLFPAFGNFQKLTYFVILAQCLKITQNVAFRIFQFWHFPPIFVLLKVTCLITLFDSKLQVFKNSPKWIIFGIFNELLSTQHVNVARFARNIECDFFCDFQTLCEEGDRKIHTKNNTKKRKFHQKTY